MKKVVVCTNCGSADILRDAGFCVVVWTPEELGDADIDDLENIVIERGNNFIEWSTKTQE